MRQSKAMQMNMMMNGMCMMCCHICVHERRNGLVGYTCRYSIGSRDPYWIRGFFVSWEIPWNSL